MSKNKRYERIYVVAFMPVDGNGPGGFDWSFDFHAAQRVMIEHMIQEELNNQYTFVPLTVPVSFDKDGKECNVEITKWIDKHIRLVSVPIQGGQ